MRNTTIIILSIVAIILLVKACETKEPKIVHKTKTVTKIVHDTIKSIEISKPKKVYIYSKDTIKVNDTVYKMTKIEANEYNTTLKSDSSYAKLKITTTGELLDVKGVITYPKEIKTIETIKTRNKSGLFIYGKSDINLQSPEAGLLYQFKNTIFVSGGLEYNTQLNKTYTKIGLGIRIY